MKEKRTIFQRVLAFMLSLVMVFGLIVTPDFASVVYAAGIGGEGEPAPSAAENYSYKVSVSLNDTSTLYLGESRNLSVTVNKTEESGNTSIVTPKAGELRYETTLGTVSTDGLLSAGKQEGSGEVTVIYTDEKGVSASGKCSFTVVDRETVTVSGNILDIFDNTPIKGVASVEFTQNQYPVNQNIKVEVTNGSYTAKLYKNVTYNVKVTAENYEETSNNLSVGETDQPNNNYTLKTTLQPAISGEHRIKFNGGKQSRTIQQTDWEITGVTSSDEDVLEVESSGATIFFNPKKAGISDIEVSAHGVTSVPIRFEVVKDNVVPKLIVTTKDGTSIYDVGVEVNPKDEITVQLGLTSEANENLKVQEGTVQMFLLKKGTSQEVANHTVQLPPADNSDKWEVKLSGGEAEYSIGYKYISQSGNYNSIQDIKTIDGSGFSVGYKKGQTITFSEENEINLTYGEEKDFEFKAEIQADSNNDLDRAKDKSNWIINELDEAEKAAVYVTVNDVNVVDNPNKNGLYDVTGTVKITALEAREAVDFTLEFSHVEKESEKVYADATITKKVGVAKKEIHVSGITFGEKIYDGTYSANVTEITLNQDEICKKDKNKVSVTNTEDLRFNSQNASKPNGVYLNTDSSKNGVPMQLDAESAKNYILVQDEEEMKKFPGTIQKRPISVEVPETEKIEFEYYSDILTKSEDQNEKIQGSVKGNLAGSITGILEDDKEKIINEIDKQNYIPKFKVVTNATNGTPISQSAEMYDANGKIKLYDIVAENPDNNAVLDNYEYQCDTKKAVGHVCIVASSISMDDHYIVSDVSTHIVKDEETGQMTIWTATEDTLGILPEEGKGYNAVEKISNENGKYTFCLVKKDTEGLIVARSKEAFVDYKIDKTVTDAKLKVKAKENEQGKNFGEIVLSAITFGTYKPKTATFEIVASDEESGISKCAYKKVDFDEYKQNITDAENTAVAYLQRLDGWTEYTGETKFVKEEYTVVCAKVEDNVGNIKYVTTDGLVIDTREPEITSLEVVNKNSDDCYKEDIQFNVEIKDSEVTSGIQNVKYQLTINGKTLPFENLYTSDTNRFEDKDSLVSDGKKECRFTVKLDDIKEHIDIKNPAALNSVTVHVVATDRAGNTFDTEKTVIVDKVAPKFEVTFDPDKPSNVFDGREYYNSSRKVTVTVTDANFDKSQLDHILNLEPVAADIKKVEGSEKVDENKCTYSVQYLIGESTDVDEDFTLTANVKDKAGNVAEEQKYKFTIDRVAPVIEEGKVEYYREVGENKEIIVPKNKEEERYFSDSPISSTLVLRERNFVEREASGKYADGYTIAVKTSGVNEDKWKEVSQKWSYSGKDNHKLSMRYEGDANYTFKFAYTDLAGNPLEYKTAAGETLKEYPQEFFTVDTTKPTAKIKDEGTNVWLEFLDKITFGVFDNLYSRETVELSIADVKDITSGNNKEINTNSYDSITVEYYKSHVEKSLQDLQSVNWIKGTEAEIEPNQQAVVYARVTDPSGNRLYLSTNGYIVDNIINAADIEIKTPEPLNHIYNSDMEVEIKATEPQPEDPDKSGEAAYAGLKSLKWQVIKNGRIYNTEFGQAVTMGDGINESETKVTQEKTIKKNAKDRETEISDKITVSAKLNNSNNVAIYVRVEDYAGNISEKVLPIKIDITAPTIELTFDNNNVQNEKYYKEPRTATVTITERSENFDPENVEMYIKNSNLVKVSDWKTIENTDGDYNQDKHIATVTFDKDGDYNMTVDFKDKAGNAAEQVQVADFTVDNIDPELKVVYDNNDVLNEKYYNAPRKATLTIDEHNFRASDVVITMTAENNHQPVELPTVSEWETDPEDADLHTATILYDKDADYTFDIEYTDLSGRAMKDYKQDVFVVDNTDPVITVNYFAVQADGTKVDITEDVNVSSKDAIKYVNRDYVSFEADMIIQELNFNQEDVEYSANGTKHDTKMEDAKSGWTTQEDGITRTKNIKFVQQDIYKVDLAYADLAGRKAQFVNDNNEKKYETDYVCLDTIDPEGVLTVTGSNPNAWTNTWDYKNGKEDATFTRYTQTASGVTLEVKDDTSGVKAYYYAKSPVVISGYENLETLDWGKALNLEELKAQITETPGQQFIPFVKVVDYADNIAYYGGDGVIVDNQKPGPVVTITPAAPPYGKGIYKASENPTYNVTVTENPNSPNAGIDFIHYTVYCDGKASSVQDVALNSEAERKEKKFSVNLADFYKDGDSVYIVVEAADRAANNMDSYSTLTNSQDIAIDNTVPTGLRIEMDSSDVSNSKYYNNNKTAYVYVTEHNFDQSYRPEVTGNNNNGFSIGSWENIGNDNWRCAVTFTGDGDYSMQFECVDLAGHHSDSTATLSEFTVDKTLPEMTVSYDNNNARNGNFFKETRTATVTIREHNFNAADVRAAITASLEGSGVSAPSISGFSGSGDVHTATVNYSTDGDYTFDIDYTDMAGNAAADYTQDSFTVDLTAPELEITDVEDKSANNDAVAPKVEATDVNYDAKGVTMTLTGANNGNVEVGKIVSAIQNGQSMKFNDFARTEEMDDLYKLQAKAVDKAGNETQKEIMFSVNRYGSVFILDNDTKDWLKTGDEGYTYIREEKEVGIREINVDAIESRSITVNRDGDLANLKENTDFTVKNSGSDAQWKEAHYVIAKNNFEEEGNYTVILNTQDKAQNSMNNTSVKKANKNLPIEFAVDKTAPTVVVSGVEDDAQYRAAERTMIVDAKDNLALTKVSISIDGEKTVYDGEELLKDNGVIETAVASANRWQSIEITAEDAAGNMLGQSEKALEGEPVVLRVLVTPNIVIQYYMNKPLFYGSIAAIVIMAGLIIFLVAKKKKDE